MKAIGIILAGGNNSRMRELSDKRAIAAMPVAGSYRCDFPKVEEAWINKERLQLCRLQEVTAV